MSTLGIIGRGRAASALVPRWCAAGHSLVYQVSRRDGVALETLPAAEVVVVATADRALAEVAEALGKRAAARSELWLHLSGSVGAEVLRRAPDVPRAVAALHPLVAFGADSVGAEPLGAVAGIDGEDAATAVAEVLARDAGLMPIRIASAHKALYHAAAVTVAGHATALFAQAMRMLAAVGFGAEDARRALQPLFLSAASNLAARAPAEALTGPEVRGDVATIARHLAAFEASLGADARALATYRLLAREALSLAGTRVPAADAEAIERLLVRANDDRPD